MAPSKIMIIRHAEKPDEDPQMSEDDRRWGVNDKGREDDSELIVKGWQRTGALAGLFAPFNGGSPKPPLARPAALFAPHPNTEDTSERAQHTLGVLAAIANLPINTNFGVKDEKELATEIMKLDGVALIAWEHKRISNIISHLISNEFQRPHWEGSRFDMIYVLTQSPEWSLTQVPQLVLEGDSAALFQRMETDVDDQAAF
jgi:hypothetical protein